MKLTHSQSHLLITSLLEAFPDIEKLREMVKVGLGKHLEEFTFSSNLEEIVLELLKTAESEFWVDELINAAFMSNPTNEKLYILFCTLFPEIQLPDKAPWCYVVLSESDREKNNLYTLQQIVRDALMMVGDELVEGVTEFKFAAELVLNLKSYKEAVKKLCQAKIVIFDITYYEPAVMLLLGIRSVSRRGVTILSSANFEFGEIIDFPFNLKEVNIISHCTKQKKKDTRVNPAYIIYKRIQDGLRQLNNHSHYLDLPTFDAIRNLPPGYRETNINDILVLCSYGKKYQEINWPVVLKNLEVQLFKELGIEYHLENKVVRILDIISPRLVTHTIHEAIRRMKLCVVDWTEWRPNVFFELGVRLAITNENRENIFIMETRHLQLIKKIFEEPSKSDELTEILAKIEIGEFNDSIELSSRKQRYKLIAAQCIHLITLFDPLLYHHSPSNKISYAQFNTSSLSVDCLEYEDKIHWSKHCGEMDGTPKERNEGILNLTFNIIEANIESDGDTISTPVYLELLRIAELFDFENSEAEMLILYPNQKNLRKKVEKGIQDRLLAAWYFISNEYIDEEIIENHVLFEAFQKIGYRLSRLIRESKPEFSAKILKKIQTLR